MTGDLSLTDRSTWVAVLTVVAAVAADVFHKNLSPYVAGAATIASGLVVAITIFSKHHYTSGLVTEATITKAPAAPVTNITVPGDSAVVHVNPATGPTTAATAQTLLQALQAAQSGSQPPPGG